MRPKLLLCMTATGAFIAGALAIGTLLVLTFGITRPAAVEPEASPAPMPVIADPGGDCTSP